MVNSKKLYRSSGEEKEGFFLFVFLFLSSPTQNEKLGIFERRNRAVTAEKCTKKRRDARAELLFCQ